MGAWTLVWMGGYALGPTFGGMAMDRLGGRGAYAVILGVGLLGATLFVSMRGSLGVPAGAGPKAAAVSGLEPDEASAVGSQSTLPRP